MGSPKAKSALPLENLVVIELGHSVAAPFAGQILGDLGAQVIKIEKADGGDDARTWGPNFIDGTSTTYLSLNRNKQSVTVNLRDTAQVEQLREFICGKADVVLQNLRPGTVEKLGLHGVALCKANPRLIYCNLGAFGKGGPLSDRPGYDPMMQAYAGIMSVTGEEGRPPVRAGVSLVDMATGMWAVIGILSALQQRTLTGRGSEVDVSLYESALAWMTVHVASYTASGELPMRLGSGAVITAPYGAYRTRDSHMIIAAGNTALFAKLAAALGHREWIDDDRFRTNEDRLKNKQILESLIEAELSTKPTNAWIDCLEAAGVPCAPIQDVSQVIDAPQTEALGILQKAGCDPLQLVGLPISFDGVRPGMRLPPAPLGEHTEEVLGPRTSMRKAE
jgi:crotonobetainyl-CoA:carnitine CoA-transferase CaiB-like acyl-CoA transferase